jgi:hypothetical protein
VPDAADGVVGKLAEWTAKMVARLSPLKLLASEGVLDWISGGFAAALLKKSSLKYTPLNEWRVAFGYQAKRGRQTGEDRLIGFMLRGTGFSSPQQAAKTIFMFLLSVALWQLWEARKRRQKPTESTPPPPDPPDLTLDLPEPTLDPTEPKDDGTESEDSDEDDNDDDDNFGIVSTVRIVRETYYEVQCADCLTCYYFDSFSRLESFVVYIEHEDMYVIYCPHCEGFRAAGIKKVHGRFPSEE